MPQSVLSDDTGPTNPLAFAIMNTLHAPDLIHESVNINHGLGRVRSHCAAPNRAEVMVAVDLCSGDL